MKSADSAKCCLVLLALCCAQPQAADLPPAPPATTPATSAPPTPTPAAKPPAATPAPTPPATPAAAAPAPTPAAMPPAASSAAPLARDATAPANDTAPPAPTFQGKITFEQLGRPGNIMLQGIHPTEQIDFTLRHDRIATSADLNLTYTPSPAITPTLSHLRVFLNDELVRVLPITAAALGKQVRATIPLDAHRITDFNRIRLDFVGHYSQSCEDPAHSSLWLNVNSQSNIDLKQQALPVKDDLAYFPEPFFDPRSHQELQLPFVFADSPSIEKQRAAAILASYFGARAGWRSARFPVLFNSLPTDHAIVLATNDSRPDFLGNLPPVQGPVVTMMSAPGNPYVKLLVILGRNDADIVRAATALALGNPLFRGNRVAVTDVQVIKPRVPYDAPNWVRTDRPVYFSELTDYAKQLQTSGLRPHPIEINLNLPPDLFIWRNTGVPLRLKYHDTPPAAADDSRLNVNINSNFVASFPLKPAEPQDRSDKLRLPLEGAPQFGADRDLSVAALQPGVQNTMRFDFYYGSTTASAQAERCHTSLPVDVHAAIDEDSSVDLTGFRHYLQMPNLEVFANTGFPFSRMADLSQTLVLMPTDSTQDQVGALLDVVGRIGSYTGYPGLGIMVTADWKIAAHTDADLLVIGPMPNELRERTDTNLVLASAQNWIQQSGTQGTRDAAATIQPTSFIPSSDSNTGRSSTRITVAAPASNASIAAIVAMQSPFHEQRSVVELLASNHRDYQLLRTALVDSGKRAAIAGSVAIIRDSGVYSEQAGKTYYVGSLPWWTRIWYQLYSRPALLAVITGIACFLIAFLVWYGMRKTAHRRLPENPEP